ncbi:MAG: recombination protein O N-terminal domain-containing protein [Candidatus Pacebacteria bacterium]|nr:recombination protein O N-terminal domain-containing protein [Candidatus Paceibacterota bacterium]
MARRIYHTEGLIINSRDQGEANRLLFVFTEDLGLIVVKARSAREMRSKLRLHLYDWTPLQFSVVKGRDGWHLTGAIAHKDEPPAPGVRVVLARFARLISRLLPEGSPQAEIYKLVRAGVNFLKQANQSEFKKEKLEGAEVLLVLRFLSSLGYLPRLASLPSSIWLPDWREEYVGEIQKKQSEAIAVINEAIAASQL